VTDCICGGTLYYYAATNEDGWKCSACGIRPGEPAGYSPELDRSLIDRKVDGLLHDASSAKLVYVSNSSAGDGIVSSVAAECRRLGRYDQGTILLLIVQGWTKSHADYWQRISDGIIAGNDPRERCSGGRLANMYTGNNRYCTTSGCTCGGAGGGPF
jgi:hypothetical protein